jgi:hypothetical protein
MPGAVPYFTEESVIALFGILQEENSGDMFQEVFTPQESQIGNISLSD